MSSCEESFSGYLRREVDNAGKRYERARQKVFRLTGGPEVTVGPALMEATQVLHEATRIYAGALRRLAHYSAHQARPVLEKHYTAA